MRHKSLFLLLLVLAMLQKQSVGQIVSGNAFLKGNFVEVGIGNCGTYGSSIDAPAGYHPRGGTNPFRLGFVADAAKDGWDVGTPNYCGDYFVPGTPEEGFGIQINGTNYNNNLLCGTSQISGSVTDYRITGTNLRATWEGSVAGVAITSTTTVPLNDVFFITEVTLRNTTANTLNNIYYMRNVDPDNEVSITGDYTTSNFVVAQNPNVGSRALVSATGLVYGCYLGLGTLDCRARVTFGGFSNRNPAAVWNGTAGLSQSGSSTDDIAISIAFKINSLAPGETTTFRFAHVLAAADLERALNLTVPTLEVNGIPTPSGSTVDVCAGTPVPLQVINGSAYTFNWTPSAGLNTTTGSSVIAIVNAPTTYTATGVDACGSNVSLSVTLNPTATSVIGTIGSISGPTSICLPATNQTYTVAPVTNATLYEWTVPSGTSIVGGDGTNTITVAFSGPASGNITVRARNGCGITNTSVSSLSISTTNAPVVSYNNVNTTAPIGSSGVIVNYPAPNISSSLPINFTYTPASGSFFPLGTTTVNVTASNSCGTVNGSFTVTVTLGGNIYYSKASGDLHNVLTWGSNPDGSGPNPADFGSDKIFQLANRAGTYMMTGDWSIGGILDIPAASQLQINGQTLSITKKTGTGTFSGSMTSNLVVLPSADPIPLNFTSGSHSLYNFTVSSGANATLETTLDLYNTMTVEGTFQTVLTSNILLTFKSTPTRTARLAPVTGNFIQRSFVRVEQYIPARRAWRMMNSPLDGPASIWGTWQESRPMAGFDPNPFPGYGTHITGGPVFGTEANGFDQNSGAASSIKRYNTATNAWVPLENTKFESPSNPRMIFIRGDRGIPLSFNNVPPTPTTLRAYGDLRIGNINYSVNPTGFTAVPNPYQSPINFATVTKNGVKDAFYVWDPKMGGPNGTGAYVLVSFNGSTYDVVPASVSPESQYIQAAQSFLLMPAVNGTPGSITIKESDKSSTPTMDVFRVSGSQPAVPGTMVFADPKSGQGMRLTLKAVNSDGTQELLDEAFASYKAAYSDQLDGMDQTKAENMNENLAILKDGHSLMLERKTLPKENEVIALKLWNTSAQRTYALEVNPVNLNTLGLTGYIEDRYLKTTTPINLQQSISLQFSLTSEPASARVDRFQIVLARKVPADLTQAVSDKNLITAYPNPIAGRSFNLAFNNKPAGVYDVTLVNSMGQVVYRKSVQHGGGTSTQTLQLDKKLSRGTYQLTVANQGDVTRLQVISNQ